MNAEFLLGARLLVHVLTALILASYFQPDARFKWAPSLMAALLLCSSGALAVQIVTQWHILVASGPQPQLLIFVLAVFLPIAYCKGDMARVMELAVKLRSRLSIWWHWP